MNKPKLNPQVLRDPSWWHWAATVPLLAAHFAGATWAVPTAIALCTAMIAYYFARVRHWKPPPVQIRVGYLVLLVAALLPAMGWINAVQLVGTTAMVSVGYCPLARMLSLLSWNRRERLSWSLVGAAIVAPLRGGIVSLQCHGSEHGAAASCSLGTGASCSLK